jgi:4-amino-4-deoxy-L-arabinose transferase-like glycosyltransferase
LSPMETNKMSNCVRRAGLISGPTICVGLIFTLLSVIYTTALLNLTPKTHRRGIAVWDSVGWCSDGSDYDNIALCLARGKGFAHDRQDPEYRRPYEQALAGGNESVRAILARTSSAELTAYRPPLYPFLMAVLYRLFGRSFVWPRLINSVCIGLFASLVFHMTSRLAGTGRAGICSLIVLSSNLRMWSIATDVLTESLMCVLLAGSLCALMAACKRPATSRFLVAGLLGALAVLTRSALVFTVPFMMIPILVAGSKRKRTRLYYAGIFLFACAMPLVAWSIRNTVVAGVPIFLSTQGTSALPDGYSDVCLRSRGHWRSARLQPHREEMEAAWNESEWAAAQKGKEVAWRLLRKNWRSLPQLVAWKIWAVVPMPFIRVMPFFDEKLPYELMDALMFWLAVFGAFVVREKCKRWLFLAPIIGVFACCTVMFFDWRFRLGMLPGQAVLAGVALWWLMERFRKRRGSPVMKAEEMDIGS